jgi:hypothetical protein
MKILKFIFFEYQKALWYIGQSATEYGKLAGFVNNILLAATFLATVFGIHLNLKQLLILWFILMISCLVLGIFLVRIGVASYNTRLANKQNMELMEILERVKRIEDKICK